MFMKLKTGVLNEISIGPIQDGNKQIRKIDRNRIMRGMNAPKCSPLKCFVSVKYILRLVLITEGATEKVSQFKTSLRIVYFKNICLMGLYHPPDGVTNLKYKLLCFLTPNKIIF
jgi:hypothetical protein